MSGCASVLILLLLLLVCWLCLPDAPLRLPVFLDIYFLLVPLFLLLSLLALRLRLLLLPLPLCFLAFLPPVRLCRRLRLSLL